MKLNRTLLLLFAGAGMLPPLIFRAIAWYHGGPMASWPSFGKTMLISVITTVAISCGVVSVMIWLQKAHPWREDVLKRIVLESTLTTLTACTLIVALTLILLPIAPQENLQTALFNYLIVAVIMNFVLVALTEGIFFFRQWRNSAVEAERFKKESIRAQLESLKNQVNPHFLFNSLNTLSSLIDRDQELSKEFLDDLATVYRYVLQYKNEEVVPVQAELDFIHAFIQLLKKRHGDRVAFHFNVSPAILQQGIPPMTLQLLVENAVKHNIASSRKPLKVEVFSREETLVVRNNLQRKKKVSSNGVGLRNIQRRYQYLVEKNIEINESDQYYEVRVPIIPLA